MKILSNSAKETLEVGRKIANNLKPGDIICLFGNLGTGKTVLAKGIAFGLGVKKDAVISPTFILIRQYDTKNKQPLYHFDLYRLKSPRDIIFLGYEEFLYSDGITVIEWADRLKKLMPKECLKIKLTVKSGKSRLIEFFPIGGRYKKLSEAIYEDIGH